MTQQSLLDFRPDEGRRLREEGIARVTENHRTLVQRLRDEAVRIAKERGSVHPDDLRAWAALKGLAVPRAVWGAVWSERGKWAIVEWRASSFPANHGHRSPVRVLASMSASSLHSSEALGGANDPDHLATERSHD